MLVVSLRDWMNFYQRYRLRMCIEKYLHKKKQIPSNFVSISGQIAQLHPTSFQGSSKGFFLSLVPRPVRAIRVTRGGLEPSAIGEFPRQAWQVTSHPESPRTTGNEAAFSLENGRSALWTSRLSYAQFVSQNLIFRRASLSIMFILVSPRGITDYLTSGEKTLRTRLPITLLLPGCFLGLLELLICRQKLSEGLRTFYVFLCPCTASFRPSWSMHFGDIAVCRPQAHEEQAQKFHTDDLSLPRSGSCFWLFGTNFSHSRTSQENYPDLGSDVH